MYVQLNSQIICYEKNGEGPPIILLHGKGTDHHMFDDIVPKLAEKHTVYAMDSRGFGESAIPREFHYKEMARDVVELIKVFELEKPIILGYSDGAIVALFVAIDYSSLLSKVILCSANLSPKGLKMTYAHEVKKDYKKTGDPRLKMILEEPDITKSDLRRVNCPAVIVAADRDCVKESDTKLMADEIRATTILILHGEDHYSYVKGERLYHYIEEVL